MTSACYDPEVEPPTDTDIEPPPKPPIQESGGGSAVVTGIALLAVVGAAAACGGLGYVVYKNDQEIRELKGENDPDHSEEQPKYGRDAPMYRKDEESNPESLQYKHGQYNIPKEQKEFSPQ